MTLAIDKPASKEIQVGMGQVAIAQGIGRMKAVVGSCVAVSLYHPRGSWGVMAHVVLPEAQGRAAAPGKFADTALPHMLTLLSASGVPTHGLIAKIAGGANMFAHQGPLQIGEANIQAVRRALDMAGIRLAAHDLGGCQGRRITFDCSNGTLLVETAGNHGRAL